MLIYSDLQTKIFDFLCYNVIKERAGLSIDEDADSIFLYENYWHINFEKQYVTIKTLVEMNFDEVINEQQTTQPTNDEKKASLKKIIELCDQFFYDKEYSDISSISEPIDILETCLFMPAKFMHSAKNYIMENYPDSGVQIQDIDSNSIEIKDVRYDNLVKGVVRAHILQYILNVAKEIDFDVNNSWVQNQTRLVFKDFEMIPKFEIFDKLISNEKWEEFNYLFQMGYFGKTIHQWMTYLVKSDQLRILINTQNICLNPSIDSPRVKNPSKLFEEVNWAKVWLEYFENTSDNEKVELAPFLLNHLTDYPIVLVDFFKYSFNSSKVNVLTVFIDLKHEEDLELFNRVVDSLNQFKAGDVVLLRIGEKILNRDGLIQNFIKKISIGSVFIKNYYSQILVRAIRDNNIPLVESISQSFVIQSTPQLQDAIEAVIRDQQYPMANYLVSNKLRYYKSDNQFIDINNNQLNRSMKGVLSIFKNQADRIKVLNNEWDQLCIQIDNSNVSIEDMLTKQFEFIDSVVEEGLQGCLFKDKLFDFVVQNNCSPLIVKILNDGGLDHSYDNFLRLFKLIAINDTTIFDALLNDNSLDTNLIGHLIDLHGYPWQFEALLQAKDIEPANIAYWLFDDNRLQNKNVREILFKYVNLHLDEYSSYYPYYLQMEKIIFSILSEDFVFLNQLKPTHLLSCNVNDVNKNFIVKLLMQTILSALNNKDFALIRVACKKLSASISECAQFFYPSFNNLNFIFSNGSYSLFNRYVEFLIDVDVSRELEARNKKYVSDLPIEEIKLIKSETFKKHESVILEFIAKIKDPILFNVWFRKKMWYKACAQNPHSNKEALILMIQSSYHLYLDYYSQRPEFTNVNEILNYIRNSLNTSNSPQSLLLFRPFKEDSLGELSEDSSDEVIEEENNVQSQSSDEDTSVSDDTIRRTNGRFFGPQ